MSTKRRNELYPVLSRLDDLFREYTEKIEELVPAIRHSPEAHNTLNSLRGEAGGIIREAYDRFQTLWDHGVLLPLRPRPHKRSVSPAPKASILSCQICGETRAVDGCHIIPSRRGGLGIDENFLYLCPTHHFLFDHTRLTREEVAKIDPTGKAPESIQFFAAVIIPAMEMYWRYGTYQFVGCAKCGSQDFKYVAIQWWNHGAAVGLQCVECGAKWAPWAPTSSIMDAVVQRPDVSTSEYLDMKEDERKKLIAECMAEVEEWISKNLKQVPPTGKKIKNIQTRWP